MQPGLTQTGVVLGTPPYMSPEQCRGAIVIDRRADLYALGCVLYELLCGRPPFVAQGAGDIIAHHLYFRPIPPRTYDDRIPKALDALVLWLLQKNPIRRPATAAAVVAAIDRLDLMARTPAPKRRPSVDLTPAVTAPDSAPADPTGAPADRRASYPQLLRTARQGCRRRSRRAR